MTAVQYRMWLWLGFASIVSDSVWPHGLQPTKLLRPWDFPGKSTGGGCHCLLLMTRVAECDRKRTLDTGRTGPRWSRKNAGGFIFPLINPQNHLTEVDGVYRWGNNPGRVALKTLFFQFQYSNEYPLYHFPKCRIKTSGGEREYIWEITAFQKNPVCEPQR